MDKKLIPNEQWLAKLEADVDRVIAEMELTHRAAHAADDECPADWNDRYYYNDD